MLLYHSGQPCSQFVIREGLKIVHELYKDGIVGWMEVSDDGFGLHCWIPNRKLTGTKLFTAKDVFTV